MNSARLGLGLFGVIARIKLRVVPTYRVRQTDLRLPMRAMLEELPSLIDAHDSVELYWFPFNHDVWVRTIDRTDEPRTLRGHGFWFRMQNFLQNVAAIVFFNVVTRLVPRITPALLRIAMRMLPFRARVLNLAESHHYHHWIEMMPCGCLEVGFKADADYANVRRAWETTERIVKDYATRGLYPLNISLNVRFIGESKTLLTPAYGAGTTCYIEIMWMGRPKGWADISSDLCLEWLKVPGAMPHWSKEFEHVPGVVPDFTRELSAIVARVFSTRSRAPESIPIACFGIHSSATSLPTRFRESRRDHRWWRFWNGLRVAFAKRSRRHAHRSLGAARWSRRNRAGVRRRKDRSCGASARVSFSIPRIRIFSGFFGCSKFPFAGATRAFRSPTSARIAPSSFRRARSVTWLRSSDRRDLVRHVLSLRRLIQEQPVIAAGRDFSITFRDHLARAGYPATFGPEFAFPFLAACWGAPLDALPEFSRLLALEGNAARNNRPASTKSKAACRNTFARSLRSSHAST